MHERADVPRRQGRAMPQASRHHRGARESKGASAATPRTGREDGGRQRFGGTTRALSENWVRSNGVAQRILRGGGVFAFDARRSKDPFPKLCSS